MISMEIVETNDPCAYLLMRVPLSMCLCYTRFTYDRWKPPLTNSWNDEREKECQLATTKPTERRRAMQ